MSEWANTLYTHTLLWCLSEPTKEGYESRLAQKGTTVKGGMRVEMIGQQVKHQGEYIVLYRHTN
jgi:hypothetical protein